MWPTFVHLDEAVRFENGRFSKICLRLHNWSRVKDGEAAVHRRGGDCEATTRH
jgi:hypothetical protein